VKDRCTTSGHRQIGPAHDAPPPSRWCQCLPCLPPPYRRSSSSPAPIAIYLDTKQVDHAHAFSQLTLELLAHAQRRRQRAAQRRHACRGVSILIFEIGKNRGDIGESQPKSIAAKAMGTPGSPEATRSAARSPAEDARTRPTEDDVLLVRRSSTPPLRAVHASPSPHSSTPETAHPSHHHLLPVLSSPAGTHQGGGGGGGGGGGTARAPVALRGPSTWLVTDSGAPLASRRALARTWTPRAPARCLRPRRRRRHHHR
jgi:hypothetical protein